jgi:hypothetical protein
MYFQRKCIYFMDRFHLLVHEGYIGIFLQWSPFYIFLFIRILRAKATKMMVCINVKHTSYVIISTDTLFLECMYILCFNVVDISGRNQTLGKCWSGQESLVAQTLGKCWSGQESLVTQTLGKCWSGQESLVAQILGKCWSGQESLVTRYWYCWTLYYLYFSSWTASLYLMLISSCLLVIFAHSLICHFCKNFTVELIVSVGKALNWG